MNYGATMYRLVLIVVMALSCRETRGMQCCMPKKSENKQPVKVIFTPSQRRVDWQLCNLQQQKSTLQPLSWPQEMIDDSREKATQIDDKGAVRDKDKPDTMRRRALLNVMFKNQQEPSKLVDKQQVAK